MMTIHEKVFFLVLAIFCLSECVGVVFYGRDNDAVVTAIQTLVRYMFLVFVEIAVLAILNGSGL